MRPDLYREAITVVLTLSVEAQLCLPQVPCPTRSVIWKVFLNVPVLPRCKSTLWSLLFVMHSSRRPVC